MRINEKAPVVQRKEITIQAAPEKVWAILSDIKNWEKWNKQISKVKITQETKKGTTFTWKTGGSTIKSIIHTCQPNQFLGWSGKAFGATAIHNWLLSPADEGTIVSVEESMEGWAISLLKKQMNQKLANDMVYWLEQLKKRVESFED